MRFALVNNERAIPEPGLHGQCPGCLQPVVARCGNQRIWHWAHRGKKTCDRWWEPETEWHRNCKDNFPRDWQEHIHHDQTGEKHIADVRTEHGLIVEFQCSHIADVRTEHGLIVEFQCSHIAPQERAARERFYGNMVWVVDGTRLIKDYPRFLEGKIHFEPTIVKEFFRLTNPEKCFPAAWLESAAPVFFDFRGTVPAEPLDEVREPLWCLLPGRTNGKAVVVALPRKVFVEQASNRPDWVHELNTLLSRMETAREMVRRHNEQVRASARPVRMVRRRWRL